MTTPPLTRCERCNDFTGPADTADGAPCAVCGAWRVTSLIRRHGPVTRTSSGVIHRGAEAAFDSMVVCLHRNDADGARAAARRALAIEPEFTDAHLWLARLAPTPDEQRQHLHAVLAHDVFHVEATRLLMLLDGALSPQQAARAADPYAMPTIVDAPAAVRTQERALLCPLCHAALTTHDDGAVDCAACGWHEPDRAHALAQDPATSLVTALIRQRAQPVQWRIAERVLRCQSCGAQSTLRADGHYSQRCMFCGTVQVMLADALGALRQPDALVRFRVRRAAALAAVEAQLGTHAARLAGLLNDNRVARADATPVYVPFWAFDIVAQVAVRDVGAPRTTTAQARSLLVQATTQPDAALLGRLGAFDVRAAQPYTPESLARIPALLYTRDFDRAALDARSRLARATQRRHGHGQQVRGPRNVMFPRSVSVLMQQVTFTLVLLPVWVVTLHECDDQLRPALVHGQTAAVALGTPRDASRRRP